MKLKFFFLALLCSVSQLHAQINLVKNPSFETYTRCPSGFDQIRLADGWNPIDTQLIYALGDTFGAPCSPEFCHICGLNSSVMMPVNDRFTHFARTGGGLRC